MSTGLRCPLCKFATRDIPEKDAAMLRLPSSTVECPSCHQRQPAADLWVEYEKWEAENRKGLSVLRLDYMPEHRIGLHSKKDLNHLGVN